jgi:hypothetical protein
LIQSVHELILEHAEEIGDFKDLKPDPVPIEIAKDNYSLIQKTNETFV